jgi:hypothetical protein
MHVIEQIGLDDQGRPRLAVVTLETMTTSPPASGRPSVRIAGVIKPIKCFAFATAGSGSSFTLATAFLGESGDAGVRDPKLDEPHTGSPHALSILPNVAGGRRRLGHSM